MKLKTKGLISIILSGTMLSSVLAGTGINAGAEDFTLDNTFKQDGYTCRMLDNGTVEINRYTGSEKEVTIPDTINGYTVTQIGTIAFKEHDQITSVTIPETITLIDDRAFIDCTALTDINIPDTQISITMNAFENTGYYNDNSNWEDGALYIDNHFVDSNDELATNYTVKNGTVSISSAAQENVVKITIPASVKSIVIDPIASYFTKEINVAKENKYYSSNDGVLLDSQGTTLLLFPRDKHYTEYTIPDGVTTLAETAFKSCDLTKLTIPESVKEIRTEYYGGVLEGCSLLKEIIVDSENDYFYSEEGVLFDKQNNKLLKYPPYRVGQNYKIPDGIKEVATYAFKDCDLTTLTLPASLEKLNTAEELFPDKEYELEEIKIDGESEFYYTVDGVLFETKTNKLVKYPPKKTDESYNIPDGVKEIVPTAFLRCNSLTSVTIPLSVTYIDFNAFRWCDELKDITILNPNCSINVYAVQGCDGAKIHGYNGSTAKKFARGEDFKFVSMGDSALTIAGNTNTDNSVMG
ncbi:MAG: leucine-rich repeat protein, partial [Acutalibacteraceae bacterium]|nr:leucine-rich repeat protein [Acutalibacteraceae bacterium]